MSASDTDSAPQRTLSDLIVEYLSALGVEYVFGIPGGHISALYEALARSGRQGGPQAIISRHEAGAAFMATGYARETGKLGVCCATTSPGATNLITGVAAAYADHDPMLVITAQTALPQFGRGSFQESSPDIMDTTAMLGHCCRYNSLVTHPKQLEPKLLSAIMTALKPPHGPAHLSIPVDLFRAPWQGVLAYPDFTEHLQQAHALMDVAAVERLAEAVIATHKAGQKIVLLVGHACEGAAQSLISVAEKLDAAIISTQAGKTWVNAYHPLACGVFGFAGHDTARSALEDEEVGLIIAAGTRLGQWPTSTWDAAVLNHKLVHIHPHADYLQRSLMAKIQIQGEVHAVFESLLQTLTEQEIDNGHEYEIVSPLKGQRPTHITVREAETDHNYQTPITPQRLVQGLMHDLPENTRLIIDTGNSLAWTIHYFFTQQPQYYRLSIDTATMAWAIGAAVGTALANPKAPVLCMTGDGSWLMSGQEITVAVEEQLPVVFIVLNDGSYSMVKHRHIQTGTEQLPFTVPKTNFAALAEALGAEGIEIHRPEDWDAVDFEVLFQRNVPTLLDVHIDTQILAPLGMY